MARSVCPVQQHSREHLFVVVMVVWQLDNLYSAEECVFDGQRPPFCCSLFAPCLLLLRLAGNKSQASSKSKSKRGQQLTAEEIRGGKLAALISSWFDVCWNELAFFCSCECLAIICVAGMVFTYILHILCELYTIFFSKCVQTPCYACQRKYMVYSNNVLPPFGKSPTENFT